jgi:hypothetical protein
MGAGAENGRCVGNAAPEYDSWLREFQFRVELQHFAQLTAARNSLALRSKELPRDHRMLHGTNPGFPAT